MSTIKAVFIGLLFVASLALYQAQVHNWSNSYTEPMNFTCADGQIISNVYSIYDNTYYDRVWEIKCRSVLNTSNCTQSVWNNVWDGSLFYHCEHNGVLTGIESYYNSTSRDRRYRFRCCLANGKPINDSTYYPGSFNNYNAPLDYVSKDGYGIYHIVGINNNDYNDRIFLFVACKV